MPTKHLTKGDQCPPLDAGKLRIYSMKFCPYAERTRLVLSAKNIPHEEINVNTWEKPQWFFDKNPNALVPVLEKDGRIIYESLITSDFLDEMYPDQRPLYPKNLYEKARDKMVIGLFSDKINGAFWKTAMAKGENAEAKDAFLAAIGKLEDELKKRGSKFFGGDKPGMIDYMIWPFFLRIPSHKALGAGNDLPDSLPSLKAWKAGMLQDSAVKSTQLPDKAYAEFLANYRTPTTKFDEIEC